MQATVEGNSINHPAAPSANTAADSALLADIARAVAHAAAAQQPVQNGLQFTPYLAVCSKGVLVPSADGGSARSQLLGWVHCMPGMQGQAHAQVGTHACASAAAAAPSSPVLGQ